MLQKFKKCLKNRKGFTLVELIVVIAILGILAAIAVPKFGDFRTNAQDAADQATARTIMSAYVMAQAQGGTINATAINNFLENIEVVIGDASTEGTWKVQLPAPASGDTPATDLKIFKNDKEIKLSNE